ncbi:MAG: hypothetical protein A2048_04840 [Deltaproteobacteria bacterium GWA2_45_12]|nr:MAG: hypothetical protein A2048_04840 [Deltaproteobacteria bacterium GWA2_45_12]
MLDKAHHVRYFTNMSKPILLDGAMGTYLQTMGLAPNTASDSWNLTHPEKIVEVHKAYAKAGSQILFTNTFGASRNRLAETGMADDIKKINEAGVRFVRQALEILSSPFHQGGEILDSAPRIAGCIGPIGSLQKPFKSLSTKQASALYEEQICLLLENKVDLIVIETLFDAAEIEVASEVALKTIRKKIPLMISMTVGENGLLACGSDPVTTSYYLEKRGVDIIGLNCSFGPESIWPVFEKMRKEIKCSIAVKPNASVVTGRDLSLQAEKFATWMKKFADTGADFIGGCCGTTPEHIAALTLLL